VEGDITPRELKGSHILIAMGTGIAPFIWALDHSKDRKFLLFYTNSFADEIYHRMLVKNKDYE
jgi:predicted ferric reductase